jgi:ERF superfamily
VSKQSAIRKELDAEPGKVEVMESREIVPVAMAEGERILMAAIDKNVAVDVMERLLKMRADLRAESAKERFDEALSGFQGDCPIIKKAKVVYNKGGAGVRYRYAPLESIVEQVREPLKKYGLSYSITAEITPDAWIAVSCKLTHLAGHSETSTFRVPIDKEAYMNDQQKVASALTYAKRYAFCNATGILTGDEDDDSNTNTKDEGASGKSESAVPKREKAPVAKPAAAQRKSESEALDLTPVAGPPTPAHIAALIAYLPRIPDEKITAALDDIGEHFHDARIVPMIKKLMEIPKEKERELSDEMKNSIDSVRRAWMEELKGGK